MVGTLQISWSDENALKKFIGAIYALDNKLPTAVIRAVNHTGNKAKTQVVRALTKQTGLKRKTIVKAVKPYKANLAHMMYEMRAKGGDISLKYFNARETRNGVSANPFNKRQIFTKTFIKGGKFPNRQGLVGGGHIFARQGSARLPIDKIKSGVIIPNEMITGATKEAFDSTVSQELTPRINYELKRLMP